MPEFKSFRDAVAYYQITLENINREIEEREERKKEIIQKLDYNQKMLNKVS